MLMPAYNHGPYLAEAIDSVLMQQADFPIELLIGEDCSSDNTREVALRYQRAHRSVIRVITADGNVGMHRNHRRLVDASRGQYLAYCEGDDYWNTPDKLALQVGFLQLDPACGAVHSEFSHIVRRWGQWRSLPRFQAHRRGRIPDGEVLHDLLAANFIQTCTLLARAEHVRRYLASSLPVDSYKIVDWPLCLFIGAYCRVGYIDRVLATYRKTPGSATNQGFAAEIVRARDSMRMASDFCRAFGLPGDVESTAHRNAMKHVLHMAIRLGDAEAIEEARHWFLHRPPGSLPKLRFRASPVVLSNALFRFLYRRCIDAIDMLTEWRTYTEKPVRPVFSETLA
ncbi:MAG: glycosyltransferase [Gammaproteobacteria bacterium]